MSTRNSPTAAGSRPPVALIAGPTASGKSDLAVKLAQEIERGGRRAAVINADSAQVYADLQILSARPSAGEMGGIDHRLFGAWDGARPCSTADWAKAAVHEIAQLQSEGAVPIVCGGTGLYIRTLLEGIAPVPAIDPAIRAAVRALSQAELRTALECEDPHSAQRLAPADTARNARALEVLRSTGRTLTQWQQVKEGGIGHSVTLSPLIVLPERGWLNARCDQRFEAMFESGAIGEVETLLARGLNPALPVMRAIGVREIAAFIEGRCTRTQAIAAGQVATRRYAKRQYTWFRHQPPHDWPRVENNSIAVAGQFVSLLRFGG